MTGVNHGADPRPPRAVPAGGGARRRGTGRRPGRARGQPARGAAPRPGRRRGPHRQGLTVGAVVALGSLSRMGGFALAGARVVAADTPDEVESAWAGLGPDVAV